MNTMMMNNEMRVNLGAAPVLRSTEEYEMLLREEAPNEPWSMKLLRGLSAVEVAIVGFIHSNRSGDEFAAFAPALEVACNHDAMRWVDGNADMLPLVPCGLV